MELLLGIDVGSTNLKAGAYDLQGNSVAMAGEPTGLFHPDPEHPDWATWDPEQIWSGVAGCIRKVVSEIRDASRIKALAVTGMGMDGVPIGDDGKWLYPFISWHCPRTAPQQKWWIENIGPQRQFAIGGDPIWTFNTALRLMWMKENEPQILERTRKWVLIEDFVNFMLCGEFATDLSMASTTLLFDQRTRQWSDELIDAAGIDRQLLCDPKPGGTVIGKVHAKAAGQTGLSADTAVALGGHDYSCGCLPTGAFKPGVVLDVTGTWEMIVAALDEPVLTEKAQQMGVLIDCHVARDMHAAMGATVAADMLEWFRKEFGYEEKQKAEAAGGVDWDYLVKAAAGRPPGANGVMFLPHMSGSHCPVLDPSSTGAFVGLRNAATKADLFRAVIEGLDYQFLQIVEAFDSNLGVSSDRIVAIGGAINNEFWMQNKADVVGKPIEVPDIEEAVVLGAAILAGIGIGLYRDEQDACDRVFKPGRTYEPTDLHSEYRQRYEEFLKLHPALKSLKA